MKFRHLLLMVFAVIVGAGLFFYSSSGAPKNYPGSERVFRKYYPENEILGMAFDRSWREVRISNVSPEEISRWYDQEYSAYTEVENRSDTHCVKKSWQDGSRLKLRLTICNHGNYRTILTIIPQF